MTNLEQDIFSPQISGVEPSTTEANDTFVPMDYDIFNIFKNDVDLEANDTFIPIDYDIFNIIENDVDLEANDTFIPTDYDIFNSITNVVDLEPSVTGNSGISMLFIEMYKNIKISNQFSLVDMH